RADHLVRPRRQLRGLVRLERLPGPTLFPCTTLFRSCAELGVRAEISGRLFDAGGNPVGCEVDDRVLGIAVDRLRAVPEVVAVAGAGDEAKARAIGAALRSGIPSTLVTAGSTARVLLGELAEQDTPEAAEDRGGDADGDPPAEP